MEFRFEVYNVGDTPLGVHEANVSSEDDVPISPRGSWKPAAKIIRAGNDSPTKLRRKHKSHGELAFEFRW
jgi:hypothetical protein